MASDAGSLGCFGHAAAVRVGPQFDMAAGTVGSRPEHQIGRALGHCQPAAPQQQIDLRHMMIGMALRQLASDDDRNPPPGAAGLLHQLVLDLGMAVQALRACCST